MLAVDSKLRRRKACFSRLRTRSASISHCTAACSTSYKPTPAARRGATIPKRPGHAHAAGTRPFALRTEGTKEKDVSQHQKYSNRADDWRVHQHCCVARRRVVEEQGMSFSRKISSWPQGRGWIHVVPHVRHAALPFECMFLAFDERQQHPCNLISKRVAQGRPRP